MYRTLWRVGPRPDAPLPATETLTSGRFRPTNVDYGPDPEYPAPAPAQDGAAALSAFDGTNPNGTWTLFVYDLDSGFSGEVAGGWELEITPGVGGPPNARDDAYGAKEDRTLRRGATSGVLANDRDPDAGPLTAALVRPPAHGRLALRADGSFAYAPQRGFAGTDRFVYETTDAQGFADRATVTIRVAARPD